MQEELGPLIRPRIGLALFVRLPVQMQPHQNTRALDEVEPSKPPQVHEGAAASACAGPVDPETRIASTAELLALAVERGVGRPRAGA